MKNKKVLVLGSGGREHAFAWKLCDDPEVSKVYCMPGNGGTSDIAENVNMDLGDFPSILSFINDNNIDLTVVGPENPLADGIVDFLSKEGVKVFGPTMYCSQLESSKIFARDLMKDCGVPQPNYIECATIDQVIHAKESFGFPLVLKADGLAAGKGVIICGNEESFKSALEDMFSEQKFGSACDRISVEECIIGEELSIFAVCSGVDYKILNTAQDHKRIFDGDKGPNTGGMGAYSPTPLTTKDLMSKVESRIIVPVLKELEKNGNPYIGFLYVGIMIVKGDPYVIEFNVRMGDPETQVVIPLLDSSLYRLLDDCLEGKLNSSNVDISDANAVTVVLASEGYPGKYDSKQVITGMNSDSVVFHAGTKLEDGILYTNGGRVLNAVGFGTNLKDAIENAYDIASKIEYNGKYCRKDIGKKGLNYLERENNDC